MPMLPRAAAAVVAASFLVPTASAHAQPAGLRECRGLDYVAVKNVSCARAKAVVSDALGKVPPGSYRVRVQGFRCVFPYEDYYSMSCLKKVDGKKYVIEYAGD